MDLVTPQFGLIFWTALVFILLLVILRRVAWGPILSSLKTREENIQEALDAAERAKEEMAQLKSENEQLLIEARAERDVILKEATQAAGRLKEEARADAQKETDRMIADARQAIDTEKNAALTEVKNQVAAFSIEIAEKIIREKLATDKQQEILVDKYLGEIKLN